MDSLTADYTWKGFPGGSDNKESACNVGDLHTILWIYHSLFICAKLLQLCPTLCDPMDCSLPGCSVHGILQARILERVAISFSRGLSWHPGSVYIAKDILVASCFGWLYCWKHSHSGFCINRSFQLHWLSILFYWSICPLFCQYHTM